MAVVIIGSDQVTEDMLGYAEVRQEFGLGRSTIESWVRSDQLTKFKLGQAVLYREGDVASLVASRQRPADAITDKIERILRCAPPLTSEQKDRLAVLLGVKGVA